MTNIIIKHQNLIGCGFYLKSSNIVFSETPIKLLDIALPKNFNKENRKEFIHKNKKNIEDLIETSNYSTEIFVTYWYFDNSIAICYVKSNNELVNSFFQFLSENKEK